MNAIYFATGCILVILVIYWGSADPEPAWLKDFFGRGEQKTDSAEAAARKKKRRW